MTKKIVSRRPPRRSRGAVLVVAMFLLLGITVLSTTAVTMGLMEMRMSHNMEGDANTFQTAVSTIDFVLSDIANLPATGPLHVPASVALAGAPFNVAGNDQIAATATRVEDCGLPPRMTNATSMTAYSSFRYRVNADVIRHDAGLGQNGMVQGYLLLGPKC